MRWSVRSLVLAQVVLVLAACGSPAGCSHRRTSPRARRLRLRRRRLFRWWLRPKHSRLRPSRANDLVRSGTVPRATAGSEPLPIGLLALVVDGPVKAGGVDWYLVEPTRTPEDPVYQFGWVPATDAIGKPSIQFEPVECPPMPTDAETLLEMRREGLYFEVTCFGGMELEFQARIGRLGGDCPDRGASIHPCSIATAMRPTWRRRNRTRTVTCSTSPGIRPRHECCATRRRWRSAANRRGHGHVRPSRRADLSQSGELRRRRLRTRPSADDPRVPQPIRRHVDAHDRQVAARSFECRIASSEFGGYASGLPGIIEGRLLNDVFQVRRGRAAQRPLLLRVRQRAAGGLPAMWLAAPRRREVLRRVRHADRRRRRQRRLGRLPREMPPPRTPRSRNAASSRSCSPTWSASRRSRRAGTRRRPASSCRATSSLPAR